MLGKYKVAHLIGIAREHEAEFRHVEQEMTKKGFICFTPTFYDLKLYEAHQEMIDDMCYQKLLVSDLCMIVTPEHIGKSTRARAQQSWDMGIPVYVWDDKCPKVYEECDIRRVDHSRLTKKIKKLGNVTADELIKDIRERYDQYYDFLERLKNAFDQGLMPKWRPCSTDTTFDMLLDAMQARIIKLRSITGEYDSQLKEIEEFISERRNVYHFDRTYINLYRKMYLR